MMEEATYSFGGAAKILDIAESKLRYWAQVGFVGPSARRGGKPVFSFQDLVSVKAAKELVDRGFKAAEIRKAIEGVRAKLPHLDRPLDRMRVAFDGTRLVVVEDETAFEPSGQRVFDFGLAELADKLGYTPPQSVTGGARAGGRRAAARAAQAGQAEAKATFTPARSAYDWFVEGTRAEGARRRARRDLLPRGARARSGAGGGAHEPGRPRLPRAATPSAARDAFEAALALDPDQPEARFNLANLVLEAGDLELAVAEFRRVLQADPEFADAHFNLAVALERLGGRSQARAHLERYLALEPTTSSWAAQARALIDRLA